ncbi:MAG: TfoX/Sxy family protein [Gaiellales bacterium]
MAYDEDLANRVREILAGDPGYAERKMFGGLCFTINGNMACGIVGGELMLRLTRELADAALTRPHVRPMDFTGRPIASMVYVAPAGLKGRGLRSWVEKAATHARSLPPKTSR